MLGSNRDVMSREVFEHNHISKAVELGLGVSSASEIELHGVDPHRREYFVIVMELLNGG